MLNLKAKAASASFGAVVFKIAMTLLQAALLAWIMVSCWGYLSPIYWPEFKFQAIPVFDAWVGIIFIRYGRSILFKKWE